MIARTMLVIALVVLSAATGGSAQTTARPPSAVVKDSNNKVLGVVDITDVWDGSEDVGHGPRVLYADGSDVLALRLRPGSVELTGYRDEVYWESLDCSGPPWIYTQSEWVTAVGGSSTSGGVFYRQDGPPQLGVEIHSVWINDGNGCRAGSVINVPLAPGRPLDLSAFTPPFHISTR